MVLMCWDVLTPREPLQGEYLGILIAQSFGRLARVENKSAVARTAYFGQSMNKGRASLGCKNETKSYGPTGSDEVLCFPSSLLRI